MANIDNGELLYSHIKTLNVLCVEDCKITQLLLGSIINEMVEKVFFADDGKEGLVRDGHA